MVYKYLDVLFIIISLENKLIKLFSNNSVFNEIKTNKK